MVSFAIVRCIAEVVKFALQVLSQVLLSVEVRLQFSSSLRNVM